MLYSRELGTVTMMQKELKELLADRNSKIYIDRDQWTLFIQFKIMPKDKFEVSYTGFRSSKGEAELADLNETLAEIFENNVVIPGKLVEYWLTK